MWLSIKKLDWILIAAAMAMCAIGSLTLFGIDAGGQAGSFFNKQILFVAIGAAVMFGLSFFDYRIFKNYTFIPVILYVILLILLVLVLILGKEIRGSVGWFRLGEINFEPVELAKIIIILVLAKYFSGRHVEVYRVRHIIASLVYVGLPLGLVLLQPDLGSSLILIAIWLGIVILSGIKPRHLMVVLLSGIIISSLAWAFALKPYQQERILSFLNPSKDPLGHSYNLIQSKIAIGSGGLWGKGLGHGSQSQLNFLPEKHTDFIFAVLAEEWGFLGILFLFAVYLLFFWRLIKLIFICRNNFFRLFVAGFALMLFAQIFINVGMNLGLVPITGISLPFISYGGSNLLINFIALGIVQSIAVRTKTSTVNIREEI
ncbi:rod shape-determining protein RodA [Patescibacteria group bacterium]|nr:rod shape-determining protein RodA [Patescibacteria group bacterium]